MESTNATPATFETVWAALQETDRLMKESHAKFEQEITESRKEMAKSSARFDKEMAKLQISIDRLHETVGGIQNSNGMFAEEYFVNSFANNKKDFFGEKFDTLERNIKSFNPDFKDEYDILLINDKSVAIIEVKYRAHSEDVAQVIKKVKTFRNNYPDYKNRRIYLGLVSLIYTKHVEQKCVKEGIAIIKQVGDAVIISDEHLKVF